MTSDSARDPANPPGNVAATGIAGLDDILRGGFVRNRLYLIEGTPGSGKTTLAMQFLMEGARLGETVLYVTLSESCEELNAIAASHGWSLDGIAIREMKTTGDDACDDSYTMFHPSEVELGERTMTILADVERVNPRRVVFDSLSELRLLAGSASLRYRRQILALKQFFAGRNCTVLLLDDLTAGTPDMQVQSIAHGVVRLEQLNPAFGGERRRMSVQKYRGVGFRGGFHDMVLRKGGLRMFPRLVASEHVRDSRRPRIPSGIGALDQLLGGGLERGSSTLIVGAPGVGKSSLATQFAKAVLDRGERAALFVFDENTRTLLARSAGLGLDFRDALADGRLMIQQIDPAELSPGELAHSIRASVERDQAALILIDSLNGYLNAMPEERFLIVQLHELLTYLAHADVATLLIGAHHGLIGAHMEAPIDASYLADSVILMRYFEMRGEIRQAISVVKKRGGSHERTIREFRMKEGRIELGEPLRDFRGVLTGVPSIERSNGDPAGPHP